MTGKNQEQETKPKPWPSYI